MVAEADSRYRCTIKTSPYYFFHPNIITFNFYLASSVENLIEVSDNNGHLEVIAKQVMNLKSKRCDVRMRL